MKNKKKYMKLRISCEIWFFALVKWFKNYMSFFFKDYELNFLQKALKEKEEHIEQLLRERDLERAEVARAAAQVDEVRNWGGGEIWRERRLPVLLLRWTKYVWRRRDLERGVLLVT